MQAELLAMYVKNHSAGLLTYMVTGAVFLYFKLYLHGIPPQGTLVFYLVCLIYSTAMLVCQQGLYQKILGKTEPERWKRSAALLAAYKAGYLLPWLLVLFWPLKSALFFDHLLGCFYVFCALILYVSASPVFFPLFLLEIFLHGLPVLIITGLNYGVQETPYAGGFILVFTVYIIALGSKVSRSLRLAAENKKNLEKMIIRSRKTSRAKSDFLGIISHEIRTPMMGILGMIDILNESGMTETQHEHLRIVKRCSESLLNTLNDLLDASRMEAGSFVLNNTNFDCHILFNDTAKIIEPIARAKGLRFEIRIDENVPRIFHADPNRTQQIVVNLLNNAVKFTETGSVTLTLAFVTKPGSALRFEIRDTGIGISPAEQKKLFRRFSQADGSISRKYGGTGLGLSITKHLLDMMQGRIGIISEKGKGSIFWVEIPYRNAAPDEMIKTGSQIAYDPGILDILLVEDNTINIMITTRVLRKRGHAVTVVKDGHAAIRAVQDQDYDVILMDINLPDMDGIETTRRIRKLGPSYATKPVIALSAGNTKKQMDQCRDAGMLDCLIKPFTPDDLYGILQRHVAPKYHESFMPKPAAANDKLAAIEEEFGPDYMRHLVASARREIDRLLAILEENFQEKTYAAMQKTAHDIKGVSGSVGFAEIHTLCDTLENLSIPELALTAEELMRRLKTEVIKLKKP